MYFCDTMWRILRSRHLEEWAPAVSRIVEKVANSPHPRINRSYNVSSILSTFIRSISETWHAWLNNSTYLTRKGIGWNWVGLAESDFSTLKGVLTRHPVLLSFPDWREDFYLQNDASSNAVGAVLMQKDKDGRLKTLGYSSSGLTQA